MKKEIHPKFNKNTKTICSCGEVYEVGSTLENEVKIEVCPACHPFYTGNNKVLDTAGRVDKFKKRVQASKK